MKNNHDIPTTDAAEIKRLINRKLSASGLNFYHKLVKSRSPKAYTSITGMIKTPLAMMVAVNIDGTVQISTFSSGWQQF